MGEAMKFRCWLLGHRWDAAWWGEPRRFSKTNLAVLVEQCAHCSATRNTLRVRPGS